MQKRTILSIGLAASLVACSSAKEDDASDAAVSAPDAGVELDSATDAAVEVAPTDAGADADAEAAADAAAEAEAGPDPRAFAVPPKSCAFACPPDSCSESKSPYVCPALGDWKSIPHEDVCGVWDGKYPTPQKGQCTVSDPTGEAAKLTGPDPDDALTTVMPDARRVRVMGTEWIFAEPNLLPGGPTVVAPIPTTRFLAVVDTGYGAHSVRIVDRDVFGTGANPVVSYVEYDAPVALASTLVVASPTLLYVGTSDGFVRALAVDASGKIKADAAHDIALPMAVNDINQPAPYTVASLALAPDGTHLVVMPMFAAPGYIYDLSDTTKAVGSFTFGTGGTFTAAFDPHDPTGSYLYASNWGGHAVLEVDVRDVTKPAVTRKFTVDKNPQGIAFLDGRWMVAANDFGDALALIDRTSGKVTEIPVDTSSTLHGWEPSNLAWDESHSRLYATYAAVNAVAAWNVTPGDPPTLAPAGRITTAWWPSSIAVLEQGDLAITTMRGHSAHDANMPGTLQLVPAPSVMDLSAGETASLAQHDAGALAGAPQVTCPAGVSDFPVPSTNTEGPSKAIDHVIIILRENKKLDAIFGDLPNVIGDPSKLLKSTAEMDELWVNARTIARTFAMSDNYYTSAEVSNQGHTWTTFGRSSDFTERTWHLNGYSRNVWASPAQPQGTQDIGRPIEGSIFDWMLDNDIPIDIMGEAEGLPSPHTGKTAIDPHYPGGFIQNIGFPDVQKACWLAARARVLCDIQGVVYMTLPNDHTLGFGPGQTTPDSMIAVNDDGTGMVIDAISHSPLWKSSLVLFTEDDPAGGDDHVDEHRTPIAFASPWIRRGYVSHTHIDVSSIYKLVAHIFGKPYANDQVATAALPLDLFTSTPDYTPYTRVPRKWPLACGTSSTAAEQRLTASWRFDEPDEQPGLGEQVQRVLRGKPLQELPPALEKAVGVREAAAARR